MSQKRYEYKIIDPELWHRGEIGKPDIAQIEAELNRLGREGWEIVGIAGGDLVGGSSLCLAKRKVKTHHKRSVDHE